MVGEERVVSDETELNVLAIDRVQMERRNAIAAHQCTRMQQPGHFHHLQMEKSLERIGGKWRRAVHRHAAGIVEERDIVHHRFELPRICQLAQLDLAHPGQALEFRLVAALSQRREHVRSIAKLHERAAVGAQQAGANGERMAQPPPWR